jgi:hypothetical protein
VIYVQAAAEHGAETVPTIWVRISSHDDLQLAPTT